MSQTGERRTCEYIFTGTRNRCGALPEHPVHIYGHWSGPEEYHAFLPDRPSVAAPRAEGTDCIFAAMKKGADTAWSAPRAEGLDEPNEYFRSRLETMASFGYQPMYNGRPSCPFCAHFIDSEDTHADSCDLMAYLASRPSDERVPESEEQEQCNRFRHDEHCVHLHES